MNRIVSIARVVLMIVVLVPAAASAQTGGTVRVKQATAVMENPRGDSFVIGSAPSGVILEVIEAASDWYRVAPRPEDAATLKWKRGWIRADYVEVVTPGTATTAATAAAAAGAPQQPSEPRDPILLRGFGQAGGTFFSAKDSFEAILDTALGGMYGGGAQVAFGNGLFAQVGIDRFKKTGSRALVSGEQLFRLGVPHTISLTPLQATVGYRDPSGKRTVPYGGGGIGWHALEETSPGLEATGEVSENKIGYHLVGGAEYRLTSWIWLAGEGQWTWVPKALGEHGVSAVFEEKDLGGGTFRFKVLVGR
jgi:opacity protein-like surface antigen